MIVGQPLLNYVPLLLVSLLPKPYHVNKVQQKRKVQLKAELITLSG